MLNVYIFIYHCLKKVDIEQNEMLKWLNWIQHGFSKSFSEWEWFVAILGNVEVLDDLWI